MLVTLCQSMKRDYSEIKYRRYYGLYEMDSGNGLEWNLNTKELGNDLKFYTKDCSPDEFLVIAYIWMDEYDYPLTKPAHKVDLDDYHKLILAKWSGSGKLIATNDKYCVAEDYFKIIGVKNV